MKTRYSSDDRSKELYDKCKEKDDLRIERIELNVDEDELNWNIEDMYNLENALEEITRGINERTD